MSGVTPPFPIFLHGVYRDNFMDCTFTSYKPGSGSFVVALQFSLHVQCNYKWTSLSKLQIQVATYVFSVRETVAAR